MCFTAEGAHFTTLQKKVWNDSIKCISFAIKVFISRNTLEWLFARQTFTRFNLSDAFVQCSVAFFPHRNGILLKQMAVNSLFFFLKENRAAFEDTLHLRGVKGEVFPWRFNGQLSLSRSPPSSVFLSVHCFFCLILSCSYVLSRRCSKM